jgi:hypothetical protein
MVGANSDPRRPRIYRERLIDFIIAQGIELEFKESIAPALGMSHNRQAPTC